MKAVVVREFAPFEDAAFEAFEPRDPAAGEIAIDMRACDVNFPDILVIEGKYQVKPVLPFTPGKAGAGVVAAVGEGVTEFSAGDHVAVHPDHGAYTQRLITTPENCYKMPDGMPFETAAAFGLVYQTAYFALTDRAQFQSGESVLVLGASGGIGSAAVQLAKAKGAKRVIGAVLGEENVGIARQAGCDDVIDLEMANLRDGLREAVYAVTDGQGVDVVIDPVGGDVTGAALRALAWRGRLVAIGFAAGQIPTIKTNYLLVKNISVSGLQWTDYRDRFAGWVRHAQEEIFALWVAGKLDPLVSETLPLEQFASALRKLQHGQATGKIVLLP